MPDSTTTHATNPLSASDFHVLMVLAEGPSYGYAIMKSVVDHSGGTVSPDIGSLYRVLARLMGQGWVDQASAPADAAPAARGRARRYYALTPEGKAVALTEAGRLARVVDLARERDLLSPERAS